MIFAPRRVAFSFVALIACLLALSACGDDEPVSPKTPAGLVPSRASIYLEATVGPSTPQGKSLARLLDRFPGGDRLIGDLISNLDESLANGKTGPNAPSFAETVKPWLGDKVGLFFVGAGDPPDAAAVLAVDDPEAAARVAREQPDRGGGQVTLHDHRGVIYGVDKNGQTSAYLDGYLVAGDERAVVAAIGVARDDAPSLADSGELDSARRLGGRDGPLLLARIELGVLSRAIALPGQGFPVSANGSAPGDTVLAGYDGRQPVAAGAGGFGGTVVAALSVEGDAVTIDSSTRLGPALTTASAGTDGGAPAPIISELPADSFAVGAVPGFGPQFAQAVKQSLAAQLGPLAGPGTLRQGLRTRFGFDAIGFANALGDLGFFVSKDGRVVSTGAVFSVDDAAPVNEALDALPLLLSRTSAAVEPLPGGLPGNPRGFLVSAPTARQPFAFAFDGEKLVVGYGVTTLDDAFDPAQTIADTDLVSSSRKALGGDGFQPAVIVDGQGLTQALKTGLPKRAYRKAAPYLDPIALITAGSGTQGKSVNSRLVATLEPETP